MVVADIAVHCSLHVVYLIVSVKFGEGGLGVCAFDGCGVLNVSEEEVVDGVGYVQGGHCVLHAETGVDVLVCVTADVEIAWNLLYCEVSP
jgi:hypothetical protein